jgi:hypothetical protein
MDPGGTIFDEESARAPGLEHGGMAASAGTQEGYLGHHPFNGLSDIFGFRTFY